MNKTRRKQLEEVRSLIEKAGGLLQDIRDDEQNAFENLPEALQGGERGEAMEAAIVAMDEVLSDLEGVNEPLDVAVA